MARPVTTDMTIARIAGRQLGLVTRHQLVEAGVTDSPLRRRVAAGTLVRAGYAVYRVSAAPRTWEQRALAACLATGGGAVLCRRSAARLWRLDLPASDAVDVATADRHGRARVAGGIRVHRPLALDPLDTTRVGALPLTTVARTLVDLAAELQPTVLQRVVDDALAQGLVAPARVHDVMARLGGRGRSGFCALRAVLGEWNTGGPLGSVAEAAASRLLAASGLPVPVRQYHVVGVDGTEMRVDFAWPEQRVVLEVDGFRWHSGPRARDRDSHRTNALVAAGWHVVRATPSELEDGGATVVAALRRHLVR